MTRKECLDAAAECVLKDRQNEYGGPEDNFGRIAQMWNGYLGISGIKPWDVAAMMGMLKMARARFNPKYSDNWVDMAGYAACGIECATAQEEFDKALDERQKKVVEDMLQKTEAKNQKYKRGDKVQYRVVLPSVSDSLWRDAVYVRYDVGCKRPHVIDEDGALSCVDDDDIRLAPKAEGCEALVEHDAPQTPAELFNRIVDCNPATYGRPRKPTGEELAEMAEEDGNA